MKSLELIESARRTQQPFGTQLGDTFGMFDFKYKPTIFLKVMFADGEETKWEHASVSAWEVRRGGKLEPRIPTWEEMAWVKDRFWDEEETVIQIHPPKSQYVNYTPYVLHLWKPIFADIPLPDTRMIAPSLTR